MAIRFTILPNGDIQTSAEGFPSLMQKLVAALDGEPNELQRSELGGIVDAALRVTQERAEVLRRLKTALEANDLTAVVELAAVLTGKAVGHGRERTSQVH